MSMRIQLFSVSIIQGLTTPNRTSRFNMKTVEQLGATLKESPEDTTVYYVKNHYGDWPSPEIFVINTVSS